MAEVYAGAMFVDHTALSSETITTKHRLFPTITTCALLLLGCKPDLDPKVIEDQKANTEAQCACVKAPDYAECLARANAEHPAPKLEEGFKVKYSDSSVQEHHQAILLAHECSKAASLAAPPE
jgi:hypothetical protein